MTLEIKVNGEQLQIDQIHIKPNLEVIIENLGYNIELVVAEYNGLIIPRSQWKHTEVHNNDNLEIVTIVGGGS